MPNVGAYEAKTRFSELLKKVQQGEHFYITHHGVVVAALMPVPPVSQRSRAETIAALRNFRRGRKADIPLRQLIEEGRL